MGNRSTSAMQRCQHKRSFTLNPTINLGRTYDLSTFCQPTHFCILCIFHIIFQLTRNRSGDFHFSITSLLLTNSWTIPILRQNFQKMILKSYLEVMDWKGRKILKKFANVDEVNCLTKKGRTKVIYKTQKIFS